MATTVQLNTSLTLAGVMAGIPTNAELQAATNVRRTSAMTQGGTGATRCDQIIDKASATVTLSAGTTTIDLTSFTNHATETASMAKVRVLYFEHDADSAATSIVIFNAAADAFQGPLSAGASETLLPGEMFHRVSKGSAGWAVDGEHKNLAIVVSGGTATLRYLIGGSTT